MSFPKLSPALLVAVLALVVATGTTSFAAGLAAGSVGTAQLRNRAVTAPKIAPGAVTGATVRDRSLTGRDLAPGTVPQTVVVNRATGSAAATQVARRGGLRFSFVCDTAQRLASLVATPDSGRLDLTGIEVARTGTTQAPRSIVFTSNTSATFGEAQAPNVSASRNFEGIIQAAGAQALRLTVGVQWSPTSATPCLLRLALTPL